MGQPAGDGGLPVAEDPLGGERIQPFGKRGQHRCDLLGGFFQTVQRGMAPGSERGMVCLTAKRLDPLGMAMCAIAKEAHEREGL